MKTLYIYSLMLILGYTQLSAQTTRSIEGQIIDSGSLKQMDGVTVHALGTKTKTLTNINGFFKIRVMQRDTLVISSVGYEIQKIPINFTTNDLNLRLVPISDNLEDITIHTGYQSLKPNEVNGSYVVINNKTLNQQTGLNILDRLNGVTSGLQFNPTKRNNNPQNTTNITIRGYSTINGPLDPLIVVDNFIYDGDINNINPNDVESITVLKDAAAASIWGARAGNGVIVIATKKGEFNQKLHVDLSTHAIVTNKPDLFYQPQISSSDYIDYEHLLFNNGYYNSDFINKTHPAISPAIQIFQDQKNGVISAENADSQIRVFKNSDNRDAFTKYFYRKGLTQQLSLSLRGGSQNLGWLVSGTYDKDVDNLRTDYSKINLRFENTYRPMKNLTINAGVYYTNSTNKSGMLDYNDVAEINSKKYLPYLALAGQNGQSIPVLHNYDPRYADTAGAGKLLNWDFYPLEEYQHNYRNKNQEDLLGHLTIDYRILKGLNINLLYQYEKQTTNLDAIYDTSSYYTRNLINSYSQLNRETDIVSYIIPMGGILSKSNTSMNAYNFRGQLNFDQHFGKDHKLNAMAGLEIRDQWTSTNSSIFYGYVRDPLSYTSNLDYLSTYPNFITGSRSQIPSGGSLRATDNRFVSFFFNASYAYKNRYTLSGSMRKDGSNIFGAKTNDKWKPLWSTGVGWQISKEPFYHIAWLPSLKFSSTYGVSGNVDLSRSALPVGTYQQNRTYNTLTGLEIIQLNNPDLRWERSYQTNIRMDFGLENNILIGSVEYYHKKGKDLYAPTYYDYTTYGITSTITANVADMKGKGIDITLRSININRKFKWTSSLLYNYNTSITTKYYTQTATSIASFLGKGETITPVIGKPLYAIAAYRWGGLDPKGNPQGYLHDTLTTDYNAISKAALAEGLQRGSVSYIGPASPTSYGSLLNEFSFKGLSLSVNLTYKFGYYLFKPTLNYSGLATSGRSGIDYSKRWEKPGDENKTNIPSFIYPLDQKRDGFYSAADINVVKGDHIRLQFINISYTLSKDSKNLPFRQLQLFCNAANLGIIWRANHNHIDPDYPNAIPNPRTYTIGLKANF